MKTATSKASTTTKPWRKIQDERSKRSPEAREHTRQEANAGVVARRLSDLRKARHLSQEQLAVQLGLTQDNVSRLERRTDLHLSTLRRFIEALGGRIELRVHFDDDELEFNIDTLGELDPPRAKKRGPRT